MNSGFMRRMFLEEGKEPNFDDDVPVEPSVGHAGAIVLHPDDEIE